MDGTATPKPPRKFGLGALSGTAAAAATAGLLANATFIVNIDASDKITVTGNTLTHSSCPCKALPSPLRP